MTTMHVIAMLCGYIASRVSDNVYQKLGFSVGSFIYLILAIGDIFK